MIQNIRLSIAKELDQVNKEINHYLQTSGRSIFPFLHYITAQPGKQVRPQLVLVIAKLVGGEITPKTRRGAALVSILHHSSLIHDDIVDKATYRRNMPTVNAKWGNKTAVLLGDYLLASMLHLIVENQDYEYLSILSATAQAMAEGEIRQLTRTQKLEINEEAYLQVIQQKTASLMAASCAIGAMSAGISNSQLSTWYKVGECLGMAFQLKDDLLDYEQKIDTGKQHWIDLKGQNITLPLIYALAHSSASASKSILQMIKSLSTDASVLPSILSFIEQGGGFIYTHKKIATYYQQALDLIKLACPTTITTFIPLIEEIILPTHTASA